MAMPKQRLTFKQHKELGPELHQLQQRLLQLGIEMQVAYPRSAKIHRHIAQMEKSLRSVRAILDGDLLQRREDGQGERLELVYYPGEDQ